MVSEVSADGSGTYPAPGTGDWIITNETYVGNENLILDGWLTSNSGPVHNINTNEYFATIQAAMNDSNTTNGHTITVAAGTYYEHVTVNKQLTINGAGKDVCTIDGGGVGDVVYVSANWVNITGFTITGSGSSDFPNYDSGVELNGVQNNRIEDNDISGNGNYGIKLKSSSNNNLINNNASNNRYGIYLSFFCINNTLTNNNASSNTNYGIHLYSNSNYNTLTNNKVSNNVYGIYFNSNSYNNLINNNATSNSDGILLYYSSNNNLTNNNASVNGNGFRIDTSSNNILTNNNASNNGYGIYLDSSSNNNLTNNTALSNWKGIKLFDSNSNQIYHNNILSNTIQAEDDGTNLWNGSYPIGGNYWRNYGGVDIFFGPNQDLPGGEGIGDSPYIIDGDTQDNYPLMEPWPCQITMPHAPIRIDSNADFDEAHGVTGGNGTESNPWILENYDINGAGYGYCIYVGNTTEYFEIRNCELYGADSFNWWPYFYDTGITLYSVQNGAIHNNTIHNNSMCGIAVGSGYNNSIINNNANYNLKGIYLSSSSLNTILENNCVDNLYVGIDLKSSSFNNVSYNNADRNDAYGIYLEFSHNNTLFKNQASNITANSLLDYGFYIDSSCNNTISHNVASNNQYGITITSFLSTNNKISFNTVNSNVNFGIALSVSGNNIIMNNTANSNYNTGIRIWHSDDNKVTGNSLSNGGGIGLEESDKNIVMNNSLNGSGIGIGSSRLCMLKNNEMIDNGISISGFNLDEWNTHVIDTSNTVNAKPVYYLKNQTDIVIPPGAGAVILANCTNITVMNQNVSNGYSGITIAFSSNNTIVGNIADSNIRYGIHLKYYCHNNTISNNFVNSSFTGMIISPYSDNNVISNNTISSNYYGIYMSFSTNNRIFHNAIINNSEQAIDNTGINFWNDTYPSGGNFWSDYIGLDDFFGPNQDQPGGEGIGDSPYIIDGDSQDAYPLMEPWPCFIKMPHSPIRIDSNADFDEAHGVVNWDTGDGSEGNPWIIEGWGIDGAGYGTCIYVGNTTDFFEVRDCYLHDADQLILPQYAYATGLTFYYVENGGVFDSIMSFNGRNGLSFFESDNLKIINNNFQDNIWYAAQYFRCINLTMHDNVMVNSGVTVAGDIKSHYDSHDIDTSNQVNGRPVIFVKNQNGGIIPPGAGQVILANCTEITVSNQSFSLSSIGISLGMSSNNYIFNNTVTSSNVFGLYDRYGFNNTFDSNTVSNTYLYGFWSQSSDNNKLFNNTIFDNEEGIKIDQSSDNIIEGNTLFNNSNHGIRLYIANGNNKVINNTVYSNGLDGISNIGDDNLIIGNNVSINTQNGIENLGDDTLIENNTVFQNHWNGISAASSQNLFIHANYLNQNFYAGIYFSSVDNSPIINNMIIDNIQYGVRMDASSNSNAIYHNYLNNAVSARDDGINIWNDSYPNGGNCWADYAGVDDYSGSDQDQPGSDGIGDTPYIIDADSKDNYPLMHPFIWWDEVAPFIDIISPANNSFISAGTVIKFDIWDGNFNLDTANYSVNIGTDQSFVINYQINTTLWSDGDYVINVHANDTAANTAGGSYNFTIDSIPPIISLNSPVNNSLISIGTIIDLDVSDTHLSNVNYSLNNGMNQTIGFPYDLDTISWGDGYHTIEVYAIDGAGNLAYGAYEFTIDSTSPSVDAGANATVNAPYIQDASAADVTSGIVTYLWTQESGPGSVTFTPNNVEDPLISADTDGTYVCRLTVTDNASNINYDEFTLIWDTTPPTVDAGSNQQVFQGTTVQFVGSGSTDMVGIVNYTWNFIDVVPIVLYEMNPTYIFNNIGNFTVTLNVTDGAGNWDTGSMWVNVIDGDAPISNAGSGWLGWFTATPIDVPFSVTDNYELKNVTLYFRYSINNSTWGGWTPFQKIDINGLSANGDFSFTCPNGDGYYQVYTVAIDNAGNAEVAPLNADSNLGVDITSPTTVAGPDQQVPQGTNVQFDGSGSTDLIDIVNYTWYFVDGTPVTLYGVNPLYTFDNIGNISVTLTVKDGVGLWDTDTMWVNVTDGFAPSSNAGSGWLGWFNVASIDVPFSATDNNDLKNITLYYRYSVNNSTWNGWTLYQTIDIGGTSASGNFSFTCPIGDGYYQFYTIAVDNAINAEDAPGVEDSRLGYDSTLPTVLSIVSNPPSLVNAITVTFTITFNEAMNQSVQPTITFGQNTPYNTFTMVGDWSSSTVWVGTFDVTISTGDGTYTLKVSGAEDLAGNTMNPYTSFTFDVDTTSPISEALTLPTYETSFSFPIAYTADDSSGCGAKNVTLYYRKNGGSWIKYGVDEPADGSMNFIAPSDGFYEFYTIATDIAGNIETAPGTPDASTIVDTTKPSSSVDVLSAYAGATSFTISAAASDINGVLSVELWYKKDAGSWTLYGNDTASPWSWTFDTATTGGIGTYQFYSRAYDIVDNYEDAAVGNDTWTIVEIGKPILLSIVQSPTSPVNATLVTFTLTFSKDMNQSIQPSVSFGLNTPFDTCAVAGNWISSAVWVGTYSITASTGDGAHTLNVFGAEDLTGNIMDSDASHTFVVDTTCPASQILTLPVYKTTLAFTVIYTFGDAYGSGIDYVVLYYRLDGGAWTLYDSDETADGSFSFVASSDGFYEFYTVATDNVGNRELYMGIDAATSVDATIPSIVSHSPTGINISLSGNITFTFSEEMNITAVGNAFLLTDGNHQWGIANGTVIWSDGNMTMLFIPRQDLSYNTTYTVSISSLAKDLAGNNIAPFDWEFTTEEIFTPPIDEIDTDGDGTPDDADADDDNDGAPDVEDAFPLDPFETLDTDGDGTGNQADPDDDDDDMPDSWEDANGLDSTDPDDAALDSDDDGFTNEAEYVAATDPNDPTSIPPNDDPQISDYWWIIIIFIVVTLLLILLIRKKKEKPTTDESEPQERSEPVVAEAEKTSFSEMTVPASNVQPPPGNSSANLSNDEMISRIEKAYQDGKMNQTQYEHNIARFKK